MVDAGGPVSFLVLKGYHVGSRWFAEAFGAPDSLGFHFEYEHCLRQLADRSHPGYDDGPPIAGANWTVHWLRHGCDCSSETAGRTGTAEPAHKNGDCAQGEVKPCRGLAVAGSAEPAAAIGRAAPPCLATGVSIAALGHAYRFHVRHVLALAPRTRVVVHVRTNHVLHAISHLRTSCLGQRNHYVPHKEHGQWSARPAVPQLDIPPPVLLLGAAAQMLSQHELLVEARSVAQMGAAKEVAYVLAYEDMQRGLSAEIRKLLLALGVPAAAADAAATETAAREEAAAAEGAAHGKLPMVKVGSANARAALGTASYEAAERYLRAVPCMREMLMSDGPTAFALDACSAAVAPRWEDLLSEAQGAAPLREPPSGRRAAESGVQGWEALVGQLQHRDPVLLRRKSAALLYRLNSSSPECGESGPSLLVLGGDCSPPGCRTTSFSTK